MSRLGMIRRGLGALGLAGVLLSAVFVSPLAAQTLTNSFGGLSESSDEPIDIESDMLTVYDAKKYATFSGNVKAVQGTTTLRADELDVHYVGGANKLTGQGAEAVPVANQSAQKTGGDAQARINKIEARGDVVITSEDDQTTTSDWALYDVPSQIVTVGGNVVLSQGQNVLKGDRLIIDLKTGESRFENTGNTATGGGRIRALFMPKGSTVKEGATSADTPPDAEAKKPQSGGQDQRAPAGAGAGFGGEEPLPIVPEYR